MNAPALSAMGFEFPASGSRTFQDVAASAAVVIPTDDHLQRLAQMTQGVGHTTSSTTTKSSGSSDSSDPNSVVTQPDPVLYQSAAAAYVQQYGNWPNYYQQFGQPMNPAATAFSAWPAQCYAPAHWPNYCELNFDEV